jgi:hypothetical protein
VLEPACLKDDRRQEDRESREIGRENRGAPDAKREERHCSKHKAEESEGEHELLASRRPMQRCRQPKRALTISMGFHSLRLGNKVEGGNPCAEVAETDEGNSDAGFV